MIDALRDVSGTAPSRGNPKLAVAGFPFPDELAVAVGLDPVNLLDLGDARDAALEEIWIDDKEDKDVRSVFIRAMRGELADFRGLVSTRTLDHAHYYLREALRLGAWNDPRPLHILDIMPLQGDGFARYNRRAIDRLVDFLERVSGVRLDDAALRDAVERKNQQRATWRALAEKRSRRMMRGAHAFAALPEQREPAEKRCEGPRLMLVTSRSLHDARLHALVEATGWIVTAEDDGTARFIPADDLVPGDDPLTAIASYYAHLPTALAHPREARSNHILERAAAHDIDGVLFWAHRNDMRLGWDIPSLQRELDGYGIPSAMVRCDSGTDEGAEALRDTAARLLARVAR